METCQFFISGILWLYYFSLQYDFKFKILEYCINEGVLFKKNKDILSGATNMSSMYRRMLQYKQRGKGNYQATRIPMNKGPVNGKITDKLGWVLHRFVTIF